jgi:hypothetical protein
MCVKYGQIFAMGLYVRAPKVRLFPFVCVCVRACTYHLFIVFLQALLDRGSGLLITTGYDWPLFSWPSPGIAISP